MFPVDDKPVTVNHSLNLYFFSLPIARGHLKLTANGRAYGEQHIDSPSLPDALIEALQFPIQNFPVQVAAVIREQNHDIAVEIDKISLCT